VAIRLHCILASAFPCLCAKVASWHGCRVGASSWALLVEFLVSAGVIWGAGIKLSDDTDVLAERLLYPARTLVAGEDRPPVHQLAAGLGPDVRRPPGGRRG